MDDNDDDKKRVLTPPADWSEGMKPKSSDDYEDDIDESTDWLEDDDFEVPPTSEMDSDSDDVTADDGDDGEEGDDEDSADDVSDSAALLTDHTATAKSASGSAKLPWALAVIGFVATAAMTGLWVDTQSSNSAEIAELKDTIRSLQRVENEKASQDTALAADNEALRSEIASLKTQTEALTDENELLKNREAERAAKAIAQRQEAAPSQPVKPASPILEPPRQAGGPWFVNLESYTSRATANDRAAALRNILRPLNISVASARVNGRDYYRVRAAGFASKALAGQASEWVSAQTNAGPYWLGKTEESPNSASSATNSKAQTIASTTAAPKATKQPVRLKQLPMRDNWFVFVDTYDKGERADSVINELVGQDLEAKVAVESRSGELFYRVQVVGIESEAKGNAIVAQLKDSDFPNARLRKTVN
ncbi:MAG: SPOR domain-containing protein [Pseudomonadota bacterium]|nr:SPOR domain-containing protein [Pseudomonadota bacterium]